MGRWVALVLLFFVYCPTLAENEVTVVATIKPIHSIVSSVMNGVATPHLIMKGSSSPHTFHMRPSDARALDNAQVVFKVGDSMEESLVWPLRTLAHKAKIVSLAHAKELIRRPWRKGGVFEGHDHSDEDHDSLGHSGQHGENGFAHHAIDPHAAPFDDVDGVFVDVLSEPMDMHIWLDPRNAQTIAKAIAYVLSQVDPDNADQYRANSNKFSAEVEVLDRELADRLSGVTEKPFLVFHDAYRYFEDRFGLTAVGAAVVTLDRSPGARRIQQLRQRIVEAGVVCVFSEPQFNPKIVETITEGTEVGIGVLDPLGAALEDGATLYPQLMRDLGTSFASCLQPI